MVSYNVTRTGRHKALRDMWDAFMRRGGRPTIPPAPYAETPQYDVTPQPMQGAPVVPEEYTMDKLGYEAAPMPPNMPPNPPPTPPQLLSPHEQELLNQPQSEYDFMLAEIERIRAGLPQGQMTTIQPPQPTPPMVSEPPAPAISPEEQWMLDEQAKIAEIRKRASTFSPEYAEYGAPTRPAEFLWSETTTPEYEATRREALTKLAPIHEARRTAIGERFTEQRARKRERQLERGAAPTPAEMMEHEIELAGLGRTYPPAERGFAPPKPRTREEVLDEITQLQNIAMQYPDDPANQAYYNDLILARQEELAALQGGEVVTGMEETAPATAPWFSRNVPAVVEPVRRFMPTGQQKRLTPEIAANFLRRANGDRELAQQMAAEEGYIE